MSTFNLPGAENFSRDLCDLIGEENLSARCSPSGEEIWGILSKDQVLGKYKKGTQYLSFEGLVPGYRNRCITRGAKDRVYLCYQGQFPSGRRVDGHETIPFP